MEWYKSPKTLIILLAFLMLVCIIGSFIAGRMTAPKQQERIVLIPVDSSQVKYRQLDSLRYLHLTQQMKDIKGTYNKRPDSLAIEIEKWYEENQ